MRGFSLRTPGRGGGRRGPGGSGRLAPGPLPAPHRAEELGPQFPQVLYLGAVPHQRHKYATGISRINQEEMRGSCRRRRFAWGRPGTKGRVSERVCHTAFGTVPPRYGSAVCLSLGAIPPHLCREESRQKCGGHPECGRPGRWRRQCQSSQICSATDVAAQNPRCQPQTAPVSPHQRRSLVPLFQEPCQFAGTLVPRINAGAALTEWAVPAQATEAVCPHTSSVSSAAPGSL